MNRSVIISLITVSVILIWFFTAQNNNEDAEAVQAMIESTLQKRLQSYREIRTEICQEKVFEKASAIVDSILIEEARMGKDTLLKPPKPDKPEKPEIKTILDTVPIAPFLKPSDDSLLQDSLLRK